MTLKQAINKADSYSDKHLHFSELKYWRLIYQATGKTYHQFRYAESLRLCGFLKESKRIYLSISIKNIPKEYRHSYYLHLGFYYKEEGNLRKALMLYLKSLKLKSDDTVPYVFIADVLKFQEKDKDAIKYLEKALKKPGDLDEVNYNLATSYLRVGQLQKALTAITNCLSIDPKYPNAKEIKKDIEELLTVKTVHIGS